MTTFARSHFQRYPFKTWSDREDAVIRSENSGRHSRNISLSMMFFYMVQKKGLSVAKLLEGMEQDVEFYTDPSNWSHIIDLQRFAWNVHSLLPDFTLYDWFDVGFQAKKDESYLKTLALLRIKDLYALVPRFNSDFNTYFTWTILRQSKDHIVYTLRSKQMFEKVFCGHAEYYNVGVLAAIPVTKGFEPASFEIKFSQMKLENIITRLYHAHAFEFRRSSTGKVYVNGRLFAEPITLEAIEINGHPTYSTRIRDRGDPNAVITLRDLVSETGTVLLKKGEIYDVEHALMILHYRMEPWWSYFSDGIQKAVALLQQKAKIQSVPIDAMFQALSERDRKAMELEKLIRRVSELNQQLGKANIQLEWSREQERLRHLMLRLRFHNVLGNRLNSVQSILYLLQQRLSRNKTVSEDIERLQQMIDTANHQMTEGVKSLRELIAYSEGLLESRVEPRLVNDIIVEVVNAKVRDSIFLEKSVNIVFDLVEPLPRAVIAKDLLMTLLEVLLDNAEDALRIKAAAVRKDGIDAAGYPDEDLRLIIQTGFSEGRILIHIEDTGEGIEAGVDIFKEGVSTKLRFAGDDDYGIKGGAGLGLSLAKKIANLQGCDITFSSQGKKGSRFTILLPTSLG
ncbi:MAG: sensor histidine kinase [Deltaproteobacteria bacterium]|nr:sensor histidine kinase [Deltaproteobacteria bacterium]MBW2042197.1 sensor histidine kinase [Deltaproteobacteria bacterium]